MCVERGLEPRDVPFAALREALNADGVDLRRVVPA
jgi:hypothetical protein